VAAKAWIVMARDRPGKQVAGHFHSGVGNLGEDLLIPVLNVINNFIPGLC
jgi:hypothetical protein